MLLPLPVRDEQIDRAGDPEPALFVGVRGKPLSQTILTPAFLRYAHSAGVTLQFPTPASRSGVSTDYQLEDAEVRAAV